MINYSETATDPKPPFTIQPPLAQLMLIEMFAIVGLTIPSEESCPAIPFENSDSIALVELVEEFIGNEVADSVFEEIIEHKCAELVTFPSDKASVSLVERTTFEGYAPDSNPSPDTVNRDVLVCKIVRTYTENELVTLEKRCGRGDHVYIRYSGIEAEIRLNFGFPEEEARRFLNYLFGLRGKTVRGETINSDDFKGIYEIVGTKNDEPQMIRARYKTTCGIRSVTAYRQGGEGTDFRIEFAPKSGC